LHHQDYDGKRVNVSWMILITTQWNQNWI
jgi:hypothetical protein